MKTEKELNSSGPNIHAYLFWFFLIFFIFIALCFGWKDFF